MGKKKAKDSFDELITKLNNLIADINSKEIASQIENDSLNNWIQAWRVEAASCSFGLYTVGRTLSDKYQNLLVALGLMESEEE